MSKQDEKPSPKPEPAVLKSPEDWCFALGLHSRPKLSKDKKLKLADAVPCWQHGAANGLHAWQYHEHHAGGPLLMSEADYRAALKAAEKAPYVPHPPALSPYAPWAPKD